MRIGRHSTGSTAPLSHSTGRPLRCALLVPSACIFYKFLHAADLETPLYPGLADAITQPWLSSRYQTSCVWEGTQRSETPSLRLRSLRSPSLRLRSLRSPSLNLFVVSAPRRQHRSVEPSDHSAAKGPRVDRARERRTDAAYPATPEGNCFAGRRFYQPKAEGIHCERN